MSVVVRLESENVKRLKAVGIKPDRSGSVVIGGLNANGKTSVLTSIEMALGGKKHVPGKPVREGEKNALIVLELDDIIVTRRFTQTDTKLVVESKDGAQFRSPQAMLDKLVGNLSFDPLEFTRMKPVDQANTLRAIVGVDTSELDKKRIYQFDERRDLNRDVKKYKNQLEAMVFVKDAPEEPVSASDLLGEIDRINTHNRAVDAIENKVVEASKRLSESQKEEEKCRNRIEGIRRELTEAEALLRQLTKNCEDNERLLASQRIELKGSERFDVSGLREKIDEVEDINRVVSGNQEYRNIEMQLRKAEKQAESADKKIMAIDEEKRQLLADAKFPVEGLSFSEEGDVTFKGLPFEQCSSAEQLRISVAMGMAMNPKLKLILIKDGSLMDDSTLEMVTTMAIENGFQLWIEKVCGDQDQCTVLIEDGQVKSD